ncbi:MAG: hypothetical protein DHS20C18_21320 [Saprospiraceae bacterium]|nr:MAG: hypothetical protein DHS20C18_21320 [Saprospiraceae bacterium]
MGKLTSILLLLLVGGLPLLNGQSLRLSLPQESVSSGESVRLDITTEGFDSIVSMQFSINWDQTVLEYLSHEPVDLNTVAIGDFQADQGELRLSWFGPGGEGVSLPDGSSIVAIHFNAIGNTGDSTTVAITDNPLAIQIFQESDTPGFFDSVMLVQDTGLVRIVEAGEFTYQVNSVSCNGGANGSIQTSIANANEYTYSWTGPEGFTSDTADINNLISGTYSLTVTDIDGAVIFSETITILQPPPLELNNLELTEADCTVGDGAASFTITGGTSPYTYDIGDGPANEPSFSELNPGDYFLTVTDGNNCLLIDTFTITSTNGPQIDLGEDLVLCGGESQELNPGQHSSYLWSNGATTPTLTVSTPGIYSVTVTNALNCEASAQVNVMNSPNATVVVENDFLDLCMGDSLQLVISGGDTYRWIDPTNTLSALEIPNPIAFPEATTMYTVIAENSCNADTADLEVIVFPVLATAGQDTCIAEGGVVKFAAQGGVIYEWAQATYPVSDTSIPDPVAEPLDSTLYMVSITDINGCVLQDSVIVLVASDPVSSIKAYNLITPNGDGKNDVLEFTSLSKFGENSLKIYNRWGDLIFQKVNYQSDDERFDGNYKNQPLPAGNYYYVLAFRSGEIKQKLTIIRE